MSPSLVLVDVVNLSDLMSSAVSAHKGNLAISGAAPRLARAALRDYRGVWRAEAKSQSILRTYSRY